jgi:oxygen-dependent protoporphyrinogen oxidase
VARLGALGVEIRTGNRVIGVEAHSVTLESGEVIEADQVVLACQPEASQAGVVLATLVVRAPLLDVAPRGTGLLVAPGAHGIHAKALTHSTAKWQWLAGRLEPGIHVLRLSYDAESTQEQHPGDLCERARMDAEKLLGVEIPADNVLGFDRVEWTKTAKPGQVPEGVTVVGEAVAGTGLTAVIGHARRESGSLLTALSH